MCGIAGIISVEKNEISQQRLKAMTDIIAYRGPDGEQQWVSDNGNVGLSHRRLSIIDLSHNADQPMNYMDRYTIIFNGEIYNYVELKEMLIKQGYSFKTKSDTEVLIALYDHKKENCLNLLDGMFAFVIYDNVTNEIFAARDRFGEKPFFYNYKPGVHFLFGSEMKCLWAAGVQKEVNNKMLFIYLGYGNLQNPRHENETFYNNCSTLPHSHYLKLSLANISLSITKYYDIDYKKINHAITETEAKEKFRELFYTSVSRRLRSDVTVGSSLSGGLDSSLVVAVIDELKKGSDQQQNTFSAIFPGFSKDERKYMDYVIANTNVSPHFIAPEGNGMINEIEKLFWHQEEPFGSASIYIQYCVMKLAKENNVTVLLDGQGADEYLAGYHPYYSHFFNDLRINYPQEYDAQYSEYIKLHEENNINQVMKKNMKYFVQTRMPYLLKHAKKLYNYYNQKKINFFSDEFYEANSKNKIIAHYNFKELNGALYQSLLNGELQSLLRYSDRNSMSQSREVRLPFLYHELVEFVFSLPSHFKIHNGWTKWILRSAFSNLLPRQIIWRKDKIGYEAPQQSWLEDNKIKDMLQEGKRSLYSHNIISKKELDRNVASTDTLNGQNKSWALLMAANLLK